MGAIRLKPVVHQATSSQSLSALLIKKFWKISSGVVKNSYSGNIQIKRKWDKGFYQFMLGKR
jgi:hypothetical protein